VFGLNLQQLVIEAGQGVVVRGFERLPTSTGVGRCCRGLRTTCEFSRAVMYRGGAVGILRPAHFSMVLLTGLEDG
jgi:hypothetical protein